MKGYNIGPVSEAHTSMSGATECQFKESQVNFMGLFF